MSMKVGPIYNADAILSMKTSLSNVLFTSTASYEFFGSTLATTY